jgi:hypothetical protein
MDLAPEFGAAASVVINRDIAEFLIKELQAFLHPELRSAIERN